MCTLLRRGDVAVMVVVRFGDGVQPELLEPVGNELQVGVYCTSIAAASNLIYFKTKRKNKFSP